MKRKRVMALTLAGLMVLGLTGCNKSSPIASEGDAKTDSASGTKTIQFWNSDRKSVV